MGTESSKEALLSEITRLHQRIADLKREKADLEIQTEIISEYSDYVADDLLNKVEATLRESDKRFRFMSETIPVPIIVTYVSDGTIVYANEPASFLFGFPIKALIGAKVTDFYDLVEQQPLLSKLSEEGYLSNYELQARRVDGIPFWVDLFVQPLTFNNNPSVLSVWFDTTERKLAEEKLREYRECLEDIVEERTRELIKTNEQLEQEIKERRRSEDALRREIIGRKKQETLMQALLKNIPLDFWARDRELRIIMQSDISISNWGDLQKKTSDSLQPDKHILKAWKKNIKKKIFRSETVEGELDVVFENKGLKHFYNIVTPIYDQSSFRGILGVNVDITEHRRSEVELQKAKEVAEAASQAKSEFLANMSHDLRTPLNAILGYTQILKRDKSLTHRQKDAIHTIHTSSEHLLMMINDILDLSKIEARRMDMEKTDFHLIEFLKNIVEISQIRSQQKGISFYYEPSPDLPAGVHGDERHLHQILLNLLSNAIKFTREGSVVFTVSSQPSDVNDDEQQTKDNRDRKNLRIRFQVEDTGVGIPAEKMEEIFLPFHQVGDRRIQAEE